MLKKKLYKNTLLYALGSIIPQAAAFFLLPIYLKFLTPSEYGIISSIQVISTILGILYTLSLDKAIFRLYFDYKTEKLKKDFLGSIFIFTTIIIFVLTTFVFVFPNILGSLYEDIKFYPYISLAVIATSLATFVIIPRTVFFVKQQANKYIILSLSEFFLRNFFIYLFVVIYSNGVDGYFYGQIIGSLILMPFLTYIIRKQINFNFLMNHVIEALKFSVPMLPTIISVWVISAIDKVFIEKYFSIADVGVYSLGYKIAMLVTVVTGAFYKAYNPYYFNNATNGIVNIVLPRLKKTNTIYIIIVLITTFIISFFSKEIIYLFFESEYYQSIKVISVVSLAFGLSALAGIFNLAIYQVKKTKFLMYVNIFSAFINIFLNFLLISRFGVLGAAWATVLTYLCVVFMSYYYAKKCFYASFEPSLIIYFMLLLILIYLFFQIFHFNFWTAMILKILTIISTLLMFWYRFKNLIMDIFK